MTIVFNEPPPLTTDILEKDKTTNLSNFDIHWLNWFIKLVAFINSIGGPVALHNSLAGLQGGDGTNYYHFTLAQYNALTGGSTSNATLYHAHRLASGTTITPQTGFTSPANLLNGGSYLLYVAVSNTSLVSCFVSPNNTGSFSSLLLQANSFVFPLYPNDLLQLQWSSGTPTISVIQR